MSLDEVGPFRLSQILYILAGSSSDVVVFRRRARPGYLPHARSRDGWYSSSSKCVQFEFHRPIVTVAL